MDTVTTDDPETLARIFSRISWMKASGNTDDFRELGQMLGYIHPETLEEMRTFDEGYRRVIGNAEFEGTGGAFPPRPVWRDMPQESADDGLRQATGDGLRDSGADPDREPSARSDDSPDAAVDPRDAEIAALRARIEELEAGPAQLLPAPDALMSDWGAVGTDDITGDLLLDAFEENEAETAAAVQTLSALRLKHLSEQLNVERARLDREHQATGVANPRSASIDRLLGLLTRRGEV